MQAVVEQLQAAISEALSDLKAGAGPLAEVRQVHKHGNAGRELDQLTPLSESQMMHKLVAGSQLEIIEAAGHVSNFEQPEAFNHALLKFFGSGH